MVRQKSPILLLSVLLLVTAAANAEPPKGPTPTQEHRNQAREQYLKGVELLSRNKPEQARLHLLEAWKLEKSAEIAYQLGVAEALAERFLAAAEHLSFYLRSAQKQADPQARKRASDLLKKAATHIAQLQVSVNEPGTRIQLDGTTVGTSPLSRTLFMAPGTHRIVAEKDTRRTAAELALLPGDRELISLTLAPPPKEATGPSQVQVMMLAAGALGLVGSGIAIAATEKSRDLTNRLLAMKRNGTPCNEDAYASLKECVDIVNEGRSNLGLEIMGSGAVGGAAVLVGLAILITSFKNTQKPPVTVTPIVTTTTTGLGIQGSF